ncbi:MAG TPA: hypothetical protein VFR97_10255 [Capillimicrobium sp.]|nr:hypothetical protein [Capillimicrobium sp.]
MLELNKYALWAGVRKDRATAALAAAAVRLLWLTGNLEINREQATDNFSDLGKFGGTIDAITRLSGGGTPAIAATPEEFARLLWIFHGGETTQAVAGPPAKTKHIFKPLPGSGFWVDFWKHLGETDKQLEQYLLSKISQVVIDLSTANAGGRITPTIVSLDPAVTYAADPADGMPVKGPFKYQEGEGAFKLDGVVHRGLTQLTLTLNEDLQVVPGDGVAPLDLQPANPSATIGFTLQLNAQGLARFFEQVYGTPTPAAGTRPIGHLPPLVGYNALLKRRDDDGNLTGDEFEVDIPNIRLQMPPAPAPGGGGTSELAFAGRLEPVPGQDLYTLSVTCDDAAYALPA